MIYFPLEPERVLRFSVFMYDGYTFPLSTGISLMVSVYCADRLSLSLYCFIIIVIKNMRGNLPHVGVPLMMGSEIIMICANTFFSRAYRGGGSPAHNHSGHGRDNNGQTGGVLWKTWTAYPFSVPHFIPQLRWYGFVSDGIYRGKYPGKCGFFSRKCP